MTVTRQPAVAGLFYPDDPNKLSTTIDRFLAEATREGRPPKAIIVPHAGYVYSGPIAASAYARLAPARDRIERVVLFGPSHYVPFAGLALSGADQFVTPLGTIQIDSQAAEQIMDLPQVRVLDAAHGKEHSLEVQLPFLQRVLGDFRLIALAVGDASSEEVAEVMDRLWNGDETLIVVSSDLSHYHDYETARRLDAGTSKIIESLARSDIDSEHACGCRAINGLIRVAQLRELDATTLDLRNSGDTAGPRGEVVGYGAWAVS